MLALTNTLMRTSSFNCNQNRQVLTAARWSQR